MKKLLTASLMVLSMGAFAADAPKKISVLTDRSDFHLNTIVQNFEKETGNKVNILFVQKGIIEKAQSGSYDVIISKDSSEVLAAKENKMLQVIPQRILNSVPADFKDTKDKKWFLMSYRVRAIHVRKDVTDVPVTYAELAKPQYKGRICIRSLTDNYNLELFGTMLNDMGEARFTEWYKGFKSNLARDPVGNDRNQVQGVYEKVCDVAITNTYYRGLMLEDPKQKDWAESTIMYIPDQGKNDKGAIALFAGVGALTNNPVNEVFFKYLLSDEVQKGLSLHNYENPINPANTSEIVKTYGAEQGLNYKTVKLHPNVQNALVEARKKVYLIIKAN